MILDGWQRECLEQQQLNTNNKTCYKYTNKYNIVFLECKTNISNKLTLEETQCYPEEIKYCPFCGKLLFEYGYGKLFKADEK